MGKNWNVEAIIPCDVSEDAQITHLFDELNKTWDSLDIIIHSVAYAPAEQLEGDYLNAVTRAFELCRVTRIREKDFVDMLVKLSLSSDECAKVMLVMVEFLNDRFANAATGTCDEYVCHVASQIFAQESNKLAQRSK